MVVDKLLRDVPDEFLVLCQLDKQPWVKQLRELSFTECSVPLDDNDGYATLPWYSKYLPSRSPVWQLVAFFGNRGSILNHIIEE